jgi:predicted 3-demethylubiquinone-9 3-methyltransferase (glyoxalase superfamily)
MQKTTTFLMFRGPQCGKAEEAIRLYTSLFSDSGIVRLQRYDAGEPGGKEGTVKHAIFRLAGQEYMAIDSGAPHPFTFTPAVSIFITCESEEEFVKLFQRLSEAGQILMPPGNYGFSQKFAWVNDRYGVSWQINLP